MSHVTILSGKLCKWCTYVNPYVDLTKSHDSNMVYDTPKRIKHQMRKEPTVNRMAETAVLLEYEMVSFLSWKGQMEYKRLKTTEE